MKRSIKFLLVTALALGSTSVFAQKLARVSYMEVIQAMPEMTSVQENMEKTQADFQEQLEGTQVEINRKIEELQNLPETTAASVRQLRERDILELQTRLQESTQLAQQGLESTYMELMLPVKQKVDAAVTKVCKAQSITAAYQSLDPASMQIGEMVYIDDQVVDITAAVKSELGIQ